MHRQHNFRRDCLAIAVAGLGTTACAWAAVADSVPESIRIQQKAEKAYESAPVVPIERGNAHHRDSQKDEMGGDDVQPITHVDPPRTERPDNNR
jgi:hypothetical protein